MKSLLLLLSMTATAAAQVSDIEVPTVVFDTDTPQPTLDDEELELANIVQSAVKGVTSVQEAPAIVTVVTDDEIRDRQYQNILQLVDTVPGWQRVGGYHSFFPMVTVRGQMQAMQFLQDGVTTTFGTFVPRDVWTSPRRVSATTSRSARRTVLVAQPIRDERDHRDKKHTVLHKLRMLISAIW